MYQKSLALTLCTTQQRYVVGVSFSVICTLCAFLEVSQAFFFIFVVSGVLCIQSSCVYSAQFSLPLSFFFFFFFFFLAFPSYISGVHHFWVRFLCMWPFFNPTIKVVTFRLRGWCMLGVFLLPAFTRLGHECQDLLSPCDEVHVCTD